MKLDITFVTFNSEKWIDQCLDSIIKSDYDLSNVSLLFCDNNSSDKTVTKVEEFKKESGNLFNKIDILKENKNHGFGVGNNKAAKLGESEYILFLNIDTEIFPDTLSKLAKELDNSDNSIGAWELRQSPYEHPKFYDPITGETSWSSGACIVLRRTVFEETKGFDKMLFMYCEDVELSWNIRKRGYKIKYLPNINIVHYSYESPGGFKQTQYIYGIINNLYLRYKYGTLKNMVKGNLNTVKRILKRQLVGIVPKKHENKIRKILFKEYIKTQFKALFIAIPSNLIHRKKNGFKPKFMDFDFETHKMDPFYVIDDLEQNGPLVSIVIRTCGRPKMLREALKSIEQQFYKNIEVVIIEDGKNISEELIKNEFSHLNINYFAFGKNKGRSFAGNKGIELAKGKYINFLDDDDLFYPEHVLVLVNELEKSNYSIAYTTAFETPTNVISKDPYIYETVDSKVVHFGEFSRLNLFRRNITPIQSVMFEKKVPLQCGGFDEKIEALEDWDLWIRFALKFKWKYIEKTTSLYRVPFHPEISNERQIFLNSTLEYVINKYDDESISLTIKDLCNQK